MNTDFDIELKDTLRDLAEEAGSIPPTIASDAFHGGVRIRHRRQGLFGVSAAAILAVVAASSALALHSTSSTPAASPGTGRTEVTLTVSGRTDGVSVPSVQHTLTHRFTAAGIKVVSVQTIGTGKLAFVLGGTVSSSKLKPLVASNNLEFRTVLESIPDTGSPTVPPADGSGTNPTLAQVKAKLGAAYALAVMTTDPNTLAPAQLTVLAPFAKLSPAEIGVLPPTMQYDVPLISCAQLNARSDAVVAGDQLLSQVVVCGDDYSGGQTKYLLDAAALTGAQKATVEGPSKENTLGWRIDVAFNRQQQLKWTQLTTELYNDSVNSGGQDYRQAAILLDNDVLTAPGIEAPIPGGAIIAPSVTPPFTEKSAKALAQKINDGPLNAVVSIDSIG